MATTSARQAVLAAPHDLQARRAYAESKQCEPARKRLVELEDALAAGDGSGAGATAKPRDRAARLALEDEREALIARNMASWEPEVAALAHESQHGIYPIHEARFELGFVSSVGGHADRLTKLDALAETSCYGLSWSSVEAKQLTALLDSALLGRLRRLELSCLNGIPSERVLALLRSAKLGPLERLRLENVTVTPELAEAIAAIPSLRSLSLVSSPGQGSLAGTAATALTSLTNLTTLALTGQDFDAKQLAKLLDAPFVAQLERLVLRRHKLGSKGCKLLGGAEFPSLVELDLGDSTVAQYGVEFAASSGLAKLRRLDLDASKLGAKHLPAFLAKLELPSLRALSLGSLRLAEAGAEAIANSDALTRCGVTNLAIGGNALGDDGAELLAKAEGLAGVRRLLINHNGIRAEGIAALADSPLFRGLEALDIQSNKLQTKGAIALASSAAAATLRAVDIDHNWIGSKGVAALFGSKSKGLHALEFARLGYENNFGDAGLDALASSDLRLRSLIANNQGGPEAIARFLNSPGVERLVWFQAFAQPSDELVDALAAGELAAKLHTAYIGRNGLSSERKARFDQRFGFSVQRGRHDLIALE